MDEKLKEKTSNNDENLLNEELYKSIVMNVNENDLKSLKQSKELFNIEKLRIESLKVNTQQAKEDAIDETFLNKFIENIQEFEDKIDAEYRSILSNTNQILVKSKRNHDLNLKYDFNLPKLNLTKTKSKDINNYQSVQSKLSDIDSKLNFYENYFKNVQSSTTKNCELLSENFDDCLIVTNK